MKFEFEIQMDKSCKVKQMDKSCKLKKKKNLSPVWNDESALLYRSWSGIESGVVLVWW